MTVNPITTLFALLLCACSEAAGREHDEHPNTCTGRVPDVVQVNDLDGDLLHCRRVRLYRSQPSNLLEAQIVVANDGFDENVCLESAMARSGRQSHQFQTDVWRATSVPAGGSGTVTDLAPNASAADFSFELRRSNK